MSTDLFQVEGRREKWANHPKFRVRDKPIKATGQYTGAETILSVKPLQTSIPYLKK